MNLFLQLLVRIRECRQQVCQNVLEKVEFQLSLFYILGGRSDLGVIAFKQWKAVTKQLNHLGVAFNDYELGYDWFHQSESNIFFYYLCWSNPANSDLIQLSEKFGEMYLDKPRYKNLNYLIISFRDIVKKVRPIF